MSPPNLRSLLRPPVVYDNTCTCGSSCDCEVRCTETAKWPMDVESAHSCTCDVVHGSMSSMASSLNHREIEKLAKFRGGTQSFRQWMLSIERQIWEWGSTMMDVKTLVMKLHYRLLDALGGEALAYIETQQVARNGCEVPSIAEVEVRPRNTRRNRSCYKGDTWTFDKNNLDDQSLNGRDSSIEHSTSSLNLDSCLPYLFEDFLKIYDWRWIVMVLWSSWFFEDESSSVVETSTFRSHSFKRSQLNHDVPSPKRNHERSPQGTIGRWQIGNYVGSERTRKTRKRQG